MNLGILDPFSKSEESYRVLPQTQIGGALGFFDEWGGELLKSTPQAVADGGNLVTDAIVDLLKQDVLARPTPIGRKTQLKIY